jgi:hypothetical protein
LRHIDAGLVIYWNKFQCRFVIDRCTNPDPHTHNSFCPRTNVMIVQTPENGYMIPNDGVLQHIRSIDAWTKHGTLEKQRKTREDAKAEWDVKNKAEIKEDFRLACIDDKKQIQDALTLIQRHDVLRPHK